MDWQSLSEALDCPEISSNRVATSLELYPAGRAFDIHARPKANGDKDFYFLTDGGRTRRGF
jgi:hypothetical protein